MITAVQVAYRLPGRDEKTATLSVTQKTEGAAFDQAVEELKVQLLDEASRYRPGDARRAAIRAIVQLRPWAVRYQFGPSGNAGSKPA